LRHNFLIGDWRLNWATRHIKIEIVQLKSKTKNYCKDRK
jgi:hypothetical protein